jgi:DNA-binding PadR family transcriptional regulator
VGLKDATNSDRGIEQQLTLPMLQVLIALASGDKHGYAILQEVSVDTNGRVRMSTGTLYSVIKRLLNEGMIQELRERPALELDDQRRRYYTITEFGRRLAAAELLRMESMVALARSRHLMSDPEKA